MKKEISLLLIIFSFLSGYSQTKNGKIFIGGEFSIGGSTSTQNIGDTLNKYDGNSFGFRFIPTFGYFVKNNFAIGAKLNLEVSNSKTTNENTNQGSDKSNSTIYGVGCFVRHYSEIVYNFFFTVECNLSYNYALEKRTNSNSYLNSQHRENNDIGFSITPGLVYFLTPKLGIQSTLGNIFCIYNTAKDINQNTHSNSLLYGIHINYETLYVGLTYHFK
jgi:hypothetical protein